MTTSGAYLRGPATIYNGKLFRQTIDAHVQALDMKTGKEVWKQKFGEWKESYAGIVQPTIANGVLISGMAGGDRTARGFIEGYDPETGKRLWRRWTIPEPGEKGSETWPHKEFPDAWKYGGGATWQPGSYDPQLDLFYVGTGNAEPYNPNIARQDPSMPRRSSRSAQRVSWLALPVRPNYASTRRDGDSISRIQGG